MNREMRKMCILRSRRAAQWSYERTEYLLESERSEKVSSVKAGRGSGKKQSNGEQEMDDKKNGNY